MPWPGTAVHSNHSATAAHTAASRRGRTMICVANVVRCLGAARPQRYGPEIVLSSPRPGRNRDRRQFFPLTDGPCPSATAAVWRRSPFAVYATTASVAVRTRSLRSGRDMTFFSSFYLCDEKHVTFCRRTTFSRSPVK